MERPTPTALPEIEPFRQGCPDGVLLLRSCRACGRLQYYPRAVCTACPSSDPGWRKASRARMCSLVYNRAPGAELCVRGRPAYVVAVIELEEGPRMVSRIVGCDSHRLAIDEPVEIAFERVSDELVPPVFRPTPEPGGRT